MKRASRTHGTGFHRCTIGPCRRLLAVLLMLLLLVAVVDGVSAAAAATGATGGGATFGFCLAGASGNSGRRVTSRHLAGDVLQVDSGSGGSGSEGSESRSGSLWGRGRQQLHGGGWDRGHVRSTVLLQQQSASTHLSSVQTLLACASSASS